MILDDKRLAKLQTILKENGVEVEVDQLHKIGVDVARLVLIKELIRLNEQAADNGS